MKDLRMLVWLTQVGISVAAPLVVFLLIALWLRAQFGLGAWCILAAQALGMICALSGLRQTLMLMEQMHKKNHQDPPAVPGFNEHT